MEETDEEGTHSIKIMMPACEVTITAMANPVAPEQPDNPGDGSSAGGAAAVIGGVVIAGVVIGAGNSGCKSLYHYQTYPKDLIFHNTPNSCSSSVEHGRKTRSDSCEKLYRR